MRAKQMVITLGITLIAAAVPTWTAPGNQATPPIADSQSTDNPAATTGYLVQDAVQGNVAESGVTARSNPWDKIDFGSRRLTNNVWGAPADEALASGIYINPGKGFGWHWDRKHPKPRPGESFTKPIYPSVRIGGSPWDPSNTPYFPIKVSDLKSLKLEVAYDYPTAPTGDFNLAYDLFLSDTDQHNSSPKPKAEVMVWLHYTFPEPPDTYRGDFSDGAHIYELYSWVMSDGRLYYAFVSKVQSPLAPYHTTVDVRKLLDNLKLDPSWYIHGIELGNEVVNGSGKIEISKFSVSVNAFDP